MSSRPILIFIVFLTITIYLGLGVYLPQGFMAYIVPGLSWGLLALIVTRICTPGKIRAWFNKKITRLALLIGLGQLFLIIYMGIFTGFGRSPYSFAPMMITLNLLMVSTILLGTEFSRGYLVKSFGKRKPILTILLIGLLYAVIATPIARYGKLDPSDPLGATKFLGTGLLPAITQSLLASYLALLGGPIASLAYLAPLKAFEWFSPILPDLPWGIQALIGVMAPAIGFLVIDQAATPKLLRRIGIRGMEKPQLRRPIKSSQMGWMAVSLVSIMMVWASTGLLGFRPTVVLSGSMRPTMDVGDLAVSVERSPAKIREGDVIQFWRGGEMVIHRVVEAYRRGGHTFFVTKGDANDAPDSDLVEPVQVMGKVIFTVPKVGWISIWIKRGIGGMLLFFSTNTVAGWATLCIAVAVSVMGVHRYRNRPLRKLRRRLGK